MFKFAQFTIYEIVGYLLPGAVFVAAVGILGWTIWATNIPLPVFSPSFNLWALLIALAYYAGHAVQGVGNLLLDNNSVVGEKLLKVSSKVSAKVSSVVRKLLGTPTKAPAPELPLVIQDAAIAKAKKFLRDADSTLEFEWVENLAEQALVQLGVAGELDIDIYRKGFYRGSSISLFVFGVCSWFRALHGETKINFWKNDHPVNWGELTILGAVCVCAALIFYARFNRFGAHQRKVAILNFLVLDTEHKGKPKKDPDE